MLNFTSLMQHTARHIESAEPKKQRHIRPKIVGDDKIIAAMSKTKWRTSDQISLRAGLSVTSIRKRMPGFIEKGLAERMEWIDEKKIKHVAFKRK